MARRYTEEPYNFSEIQPYVCVETRQSMTLLIQANHCYFYDTCSFRKHAASPEQSKLAEYFRKNDGIVLLTRTILMELCDADGKLWSSHIEYMRKLFERDVRIVLVYEEDFGQLISMCYKGTAMRNQCLAYAVRSAAGKAGTVADTLTAYKDLKREVLSNMENTDPELYQKFFRRVRANKEAKDNLGEEMIAICVHLLSNLPGNMDYKYVVLTEDKGAIGLLHRVRKNIFEHKGKKLVAVFTTARLSQLMWEENIQKNQEQILELLQADTAEENISTICLEKYDLEQTEKTMSRQELAEKIANRSGIRIII